MWMIKKRVKRWKIVGGQKENRSERMREKQPLYFEDRNNVSTFYSISGIYNNVPFHQKFMLYGNMYRAESKKALGNVNNIYYCSAYQATAV